MKYPPSHFRQYAAVLLVAIVVSLFVVSERTVAENKLQDIPARSDDDIDDIKSIVKQYRLSLSDNFLEKTHGYPSVIKFCEVFLQDFKAGRVEYVKPTLTTDDVNHPALWRYRACRNYEHSQEQRSKPDYLFRDLTDIGTTHFRLYRLELDGDLSNGSEEVVYGEKEVSPSKNLDYKGPMSLRGRYAQVDTRACTLTYYNSIYKRSEFDRTMDAKTSLIQYKNTSYIVALTWREPKTELKYWSPIFYGVLWGSSHAPGLQNVAQCSFWGIVED